MTKDSETHYRVSLSCVPTKLPTWLLGPSQGLLRSEFQKAKRAKDVHHSICWIECVPVLPLLLVPRRIMPYDNQRASGAKYLTPHCTNCRPQMWSSSDGGVFVPLVARCGQAATQKHVLLTGLSTSTIWSNLFCLHLDQICLLFALSNPPFET